MRLGSPSSSSSRTVPRSPPGGARVSGRAGALLGVAGHSLALHRLLLLAAAPLTYCSPVHHASREPA